MLAIRNAQLPELLQQKLLFLLTGTVLLFRNHEVFFLVSYSRSVDL